MRLQWQIGFSDRKGMAVQQGEFKEFVQLLAAEVEVRNGKPLSSVAIELWWDRMGRYDLQQVRRAFELHGRDEQGRFMPQPADLIRHIEGTATDRALLAWNRVLTAIGSVGAYQDVDFGEPAIHAAVHDLGGWVRLCRGDTRELGFVQKRFTDAYRTYAARGVTECPLVLSGDRSPDSEYEKHGIRPPVPKLLAARTCKEVLEGQPLLVSPGQLLQMAHEAKR